MSFIYKITNLLNNKVYIGKTDIHTIEERFKEHIKDSYKYIDRPLYRAFNKYGIENFKIEEIEQCDIKDSCEREKYWIEYYNSYKYGYNATLGGDGKAYIDRDLVIKTYNQVQNQNKVAELLNVSTDSVQYILKENNIQILSSAEVNKKKLGHAVAMLDKNTEQILKTFSDQSDAARWLIEQKKTTIKNSQKVSYIIGRVVRGLRKTAYNYKWKSI